MNDIIKTLVAAIPEEIDSTYITHCFICGLPLRDADSVDCGIGPVCRKRGGYTHLDPQQRKEANVVLRFLSWRNSTGDLEAEDLLVWGDWFIEYGLEVLYYRAARRFASVEFWAKGSSIIIRTPRYDERWLDILGRTRLHRFWDVNAKGHEFSNRAGAQLWRAVQERFKTGIAVQRVLVGDGEDAAMVHAIDGPAPELLAVVAA